MPSIHPSTHPSTLPHSLFFSYLSLNTAPSYLLLPLSCYLLILIYISTFLLIPLHFYGLSLPDHPTLVVYKDVFGSCAISAAIFALKFHGQPPAWWSVKAARSIGRSVDPNYLHARLSLISQGAICNRSPPRQPTAYINCSSLYCCSYCTYVAEEIYIYSILFSPAKR
jgi:hypothetical protein